VDSTKEVISRLRKKSIVRSNHTWLITGDVESFYTNVRVEETIDQLRILLSDVKVSNGIPQNRIPDLLQAVMFCNCFGFGGNFYKQHNGIAMGTSCAPAFANVNLALKEQFVESIMRAQSSDIEDGLIFYVRYIDDCFLIFRGTEAACQSCLNDISLKLKPFKIGWEIHSCVQPTPFLDVEFFFEQGFGPVGIQSRVFRKRMNRHQYIPWSSAHPKSVKKAFIKAEMTRYMVICSTRELFEEKVREFMLALGRRGYPSDILHVWKKQVRYEDRLHTLSKNKGVDARGLPLMLPSSYDEVWNFIDTKSISNAMKSEWSKLGPIPPSLSVPLIKSLRKTESLFDRFSMWNKAVLLSEPGRALVLR